MIKQKHFINNALIVAVSTFALFIAYANRRAFNLYFFYISSDDYMDLYHTVFWSKLSHAFTNYSSVYSPLLLASIRALTALHVPHGDAFDMRKDLLFLIFIPIPFCVLFIYKTLNNIGNIEFGSWYKYVLTLQLTIFFSPFIFLFNRANLGIYSVLLLLLLVYVLSLTYFNTDPVIPGSCILSPRPLNILVSLRLPIVILLLASFIKPYFLLSLLLYISLGSSSNFHKLRLSFLAFLSYLAPNALIFSLYPLIGRPFKGSISLWFSNMLNISGSHSFVKDSTVYCLCPACIARYMATLLPNHSGVEWCLHAILIISLFLLSFILLIVFARSWFRSLQLYRKITKSGDQQSSLIHESSRILLALTPVILAPFFIATVGYYGFALLLPCLLICLRIISELAAPRIFLSFIIDLQRSLFLFALASAIPILPSFGNVDLIPSSLSFMMLRAVQIILLSKLAIKFCMVSSFVSKPPYRISPSLG
jgi:hypothetical protein